MSDAGPERIAEAFARSRADGRRAAFMPYMMGGYPDMETSRAVGEALVAGGADLLELGVPFSDPLADGPVIHEAATTALAAGASLGSVVGLATELARAVPVILMCYVNPILARGLERVCDELAAAGVSGLIVPDLPLEEAPAARAACAAVGIAFVPLVAPTTPDARLAQIAASATGFLYAVTVTGTTGERGADGAGGSGPAEVVARVRAGAGDVPIALGFGISTPEQAAAAAGAGADGVIVGTRLVRAAGNGADGPREVAELSQALSAALSSS